MPNKTFIWEVVSKWLTEQLSTIPKVQLWGKATTNGDTPLLVDSDGHLQVDSLTTGLPSGAATEATLVDIKTAIEILDNIVSGSEAQVDIVASLPAGSNNIGKTNIQVDGLSPGMDDATSALEVIQYDHHEIHEGSSFTAHYENQVTNVGEMTVIGFNTPDSTTWAHMVIKGEATGAARMMIYESPSIDDDEGTQLTIYNRNRNSAAASILTSVESTPVADKLTSYDETEAAGANISTTTELSRIFLGSAFGPFESGNASRGELEFVLKQDTQYAIMIESLTNDTCYHNLTLNWYEHEDIN